MRSPFHVANLTGRPVVVPKKNNKSILVTDELCCQIAVHVQSAGVDFLRNISRRQGDGTGGRVHQTFKAPCDATNAPRGR